MYVSDLKKDFYEFLSGKRVILVIHYDIDSICACKILQVLFRDNQISYTVVTVQGVDDLERSFREHCNDVKYFILVNCGGTVNLIDLLEPADDVVLYLLDSHRPTDLYNIFNDDQIRLLWKPEEDANVPDFNDVFCDDEVDDDEEQQPEDDEQSDVEESASKRRRLNEEVILKRRERRLWEDKRDKILFDYSQFTYYTKASAIILFELAWSLSKDDKNVLWLAVVALTEQMLLNKIEETLYVLEAGNLQSHATRLQNRTNDTDVSTSLKITFEKDLKLPLYRHWSIESSLKYSSFMVCRLKLWSYRGEERLYELLAEMGFPLAQCRQAYRSMDLQFRNEFQPALESVSEKFGLADLTYATFMLQYGYRNRYCAADIVYALLAILENSSKDKKAEERLHVSLECLSRRNVDVINAAIESAKVINRLLYNTVRSVLNMKSIISAGPFIYYIVQEGHDGWYMYSHLHMLSLLAHFILRGYAAKSRNRKATSVPLIVSAPRNVEKGTCVMLGIPPLCENSPKSFFGKAFEQVVDQMNFNYTCDFFDTSFLEIRTSDRIRFFDALTAIIG